MQSECNIDLEKWDVADNIDLYYMIQDFEEYFELKFMKKPILVKKCTSDPSDVKGGKKGLPPKRAGTSGASTNSASTGPSSEQTPNRGS